MPLSLLYPHFLADLWRGAMTLEWDDLNAYRALEMPALVPRLPHFREIGCVAAADILEAFWKERALPRQGFSDGVKDNQLVAMALAQVMVTLESRPGPEGVETLAELAPPAHPSGVEMAKFMRRFGLGSGAVQRSPRGLLIDAMDAASRGGVPEMTLLSDDEQVLIQSGLNAFGFPDVEVPHSFAWKPHKKMRGVGHAQALFRDSRDGTTAVPVFLTSGSTYAEHIHLGREEVIPVSGRLRNIPGEGIIHTPLVEGDDPAVYIGIVWGGVVFTGFSGTWGSDLVAHHKITADSVAAVFRDVPPDSRDDRPRRELARYLFALLEGRDTTPPLGSIRDRVARLASLKPKDRVAFARKRLPKMLIMPGLTDD